MPMRRTPLRRRRRAFPVQRAEYQSNGIPRPGEFSVQRKSTSRSVRDQARRARRARLLSKYSPREPGHDLAVGGRRQVLARAPRRSRGSSRPGPGAYSTTAARAQRSPDALEDRHLSDAGPAVAAETRFDRVDADHRDGAHRRRQRQHATVVLRAARSTARAASRRERSMVGMPVARTPRCRGRRTAARTGRARTSRAARGRRRRRSPPAATSPRCNASRYGRCCP